jgi:hypothetical protein
VKVAQEWTAPPDNSQLAAKAVSWLSLYAMGLPVGGGEDFFIHDGTEKDTVGFPIYTSWLPTLKSLSGTYPQQPAAVYIDFSQGYGNTSGGSLNNVENEIANLWLNYQAGFTVVTVQEVNNGAVKLSQFKAVLPLNGVGANLTAYKSAGGTVLTQAEQLTQYTTAYAQIDAPDVGDLQTVPALAANGNSASITLANITSGTTYNDPIAFSPAGLGLNSGNYYLVNSATGTAVPQTQQSNGRPGRRRPAVPRRRPDQRWFRRQPHPDHPGRRTGRGDLDHVAERCGRRERLLAAQPDVRGRSRGGRDGTGHVLGHVGTGLHGAVRHGGQRLPKWSDRQQSGDRHVGHGERSAGRRAVR